LGIVGEARLRIPHTLTKTAWRLRASLTVKLVLLVGIFVALPIVLYGQFESADRKMQDLVARSIQHRSWLIAQAISPILDQSEGPPSRSLNEILRKYSFDGTILKLMFRPAALKGGTNFYYVASAPQVGSGRVDAELNSLAQHGILEKLSDTCTWDSPLEIRYTRPDGGEQILTSVIPIQSRWGCWVLISAHAASEFLNTSIGRPYWQTREVRIAALIYLVGLFLAGLIAWSVRTNVNHFRRVAREIRQGRIGRHSFTARNVIPELASVAADFDKLVLDLHHVARDIRQTAEDNAHSFKAPLATIQSSLEPIKRLLPSDNPRAQRALSLVDLSINRLRALVIAAQRLDNNTADLIDSPRALVNLTQVIADVLLRYRDILSERGIRLSRHLDDGVMVRAGVGVIDVVIENILDNAISFSPSGGTITVTLLRNENHIDLLIEDEGPGIDPKKIDRIFDRYFSLRASEVAAVQEDPAQGGDEQKQGHAGLGLWIVRRNVEALGGRISAANRLGGGLCVHVTLPINDL